MFSLKVEIENQIEDVARKMRTAMMLNNLEDYALLVKSLKRLVEIKLELKYLEG